MTVPGLAMGRQQAERLMRDTCTVTRVDPAAPEVWNDATLQYEPGVTTAYDGPCRLRPAGTQDHGSNAADQVFIESQYTLSLPVATSGDIVKNDTVMVTSSATDADMVGRKYTVIAVPSYSDGTARRFPVRETQ